MCDFCKMKLEDENDEIDWKYYTGTPVTCEDDSGVEVELFTSSSGDSGLVINFNFTWTEPLSLMVNGKAFNAETPIYINDWASLYGVKYCPMCGRKLSEVENG